MSGFPWPLDGVQTWFEALWNEISSAAFNAVNVVSQWIWDGVMWVRDRIQEGLNGVSQYLWEKIVWLKTGFEGFMNWIWSQIKPLLGPVAVWIEQASTWAWTTLFNFIRDPVGSLSSGWTWISETIWTKISWLNDRVSEGWTWLSDSIGQGLNDLYSAVSQSIGNVAKTVGGAVTGLWDSLTGLASDLLSGMATSLGTALQGAFDWIIKHLMYLGEMITGAMRAVKAAVMPAITPFFSDILNAATASLGPHSPDPETEMATKAFTHQLMKRLETIPPKHKSDLPSLNTLLASAAGVVGLNMLTVTGMGAIATALDLAHPVKMTGIMHVSSDLLNSLNFPSMIGPLIFSNIYVGLIIPLRYRWMEMYTPMIPPGPDLIKMVVREAFDPKMVISAPGEFSAAMKFHGFQKVWSDRYWTAHFVPIGLRQAYDNLWRGLWDKEKFMFALHIADVHPMWREDIFKVAFRPPGFREIGYGYDTGVYTLEDIARYRRMGGLTPEDAAKAAAAMVAYRTEAEREALRREALADYVAGLDTVEELRTNLTAIGGRSEIIELWIARADFRASRDLLLDRIKVAVTDHVKGWSSFEELRQELIEFGVSSERRAVLLEEAASRRKGYNREETTQKSKVIPVSRVRKARDLGLIGDEEYIMRLMAHNYAEADARLDLSIELTPKPLTPEEIARRQATVTAKMKRSARRWEVREKTLVDELDLTTLQQKDVDEINTETLEVIDAQIAVYDILIEEAEEEKIPILDARRNVLVQRKEATTARGDARVKRLTEQHSNLVEAQEMATKQQEEEQWEYDNEFNLVGEQQ